MNYDSDSIVTLVGLEMITQSPTAYVGDLGSPKSLFQIKKEITDNCADESKMVDDLCIDIILRCNSTRDKYQCVIKDNGRGVPVDKVKNSFTVVGTSGKYKIDGKESAYKMSSGTYGIGAKAAAGLSKIFTVISSQENDSGSALLVVKDAITERSEVYEDIKFPRGTLIYFEPSSKFFETIDKFWLGEGMTMFTEYIDWLINFDDKVNARIFLKEGLIDDSLFSKDVNTIYSTLSVCDGEQVKIRKFPDHVDFMKHKLGIDSEILIQNKIEYHKDRLKFNIHYILDADFESMNNTKYMSAVNNVSIAASESHQNIIFANLLREKISVYSDNIKISKFIKNNYRLPMYFSIAVYWDGAKFLDLLKTSYRDSEFAAAYFSSVTKLLDKTEDSHFKRMYEILQFHIEDEYIKFVNKTTKQKGKTRGTIASKINKFNSFVPCRTSDPEIAELFIVEGESAGGTLKTVRDKEFQAVWTMGGKPKNSLKVDIETALQDKVFEDLTTIIGLNPGDPIENINYKHIFLTADPDHHGAHIDTILVGNLFTINPAILDSGYVYMIIPPQFKLSYKQSRTFVRNEMDLFKFKVESIFDYLFKFSILVGDEKHRVEFTEPEEVFAFCFTTFQLAEIIEQTAKRLNVDPIILEYLARNYKYLNPMRVDRLKQHLPYQNISYNEELNYLILIEGNVDIYVPMENVVVEIEKNILPHFKSLCKQVWEPCVTIVGHDDFNNVPMLITEIKQLLSSGLKDVKVAPFKGLGELSDEETKLTCASPLTRRFIKIKSIGDVQRIYDMLGKDVDERKKL